MSSEPALAEHAVQEEQSLKSPLRYPGGKSRVAKMLLDYCPDHREYREVFAGGASLFFQKQPSESSWINDKHPGLYAFYRALKEDFEAFADLCRRQPRDLKATFEKWSSKTDLMTSRSRDTLVERAVQFYFINRTVWGGRVVYDPERKSRLYFSNPDGWSNLPKKLAHLRQVSERLQGTKITSFTFEACLKGAKSDVFIYCDPPYVRDTTCSSSDKLYDVSFDEYQHELLANLLAGTQAKVMLSYDDCPEVKKLYSGSKWRIVPLEWKYSGTYAVSKEQKSNGIKEKKTMGRELLILNY